ncbi:UDP-N-acetylmuramate dehydrogenase [Patescibacteria group bacterium]|nr:UDP-N-acetylmuramate dehydrogenase [Patescibacteria group bacterium]MBU1885563.1 UDP-N-acetylmuramate dehydrogenase [Patescibacteria group bacterium]
MSILTQLKQAFPQLNFKPNFLLAPQTYSKIGGQAEVYLELKKRQQIIEIINFCKNKNIKLTLLGGASNVIIDDRGISGLVLHLKNNKLIKLDKSTIDGKKLIQAEAGLKTSLLVKKVIDLGYFGLEYFLGIPGTVGGAIYNNAHYLENLISEHINRVEIIDQQNKVKWISKKDCEFRYGSSRFQKTQEIILRVEFVLKKGSKEKSHKLVQKATQYRAKTQPLGKPSSGCIFKNTPNTPELKKLFPQFKNQQFVSAGFLIDRAGLKGVRVGDVEVSKKHAAFFINQGKGTATDLKKLIKLVKQKIKQKFNINLQEEIFYLS